jgi:hypothetical protein
MSLDCCLKREVVESCMNEGAHRIESWGVAFSKSMEVWAAPSLANPCYGEHHSLARATKEMRQRQWTPHRARDESQIQRQQQ